MTNTTFNATGTADNLAKHSGIRTILQWLAEPPAPHPADELPSLRANLKAWRDVGGTPQQRARALDGLYRRSCSVIDDLLPSLTDLTLPVPAKARRVVRSVLDLLQMLADETLVLPNGVGVDRVDPIERMATLDLAVWRSLNALARQLLIGHLIAAPARSGTWQQLHQTFAVARAQKLHTLVPEGAASSPQHLYHAAVLLGCAQPASLTAREVLFLAAYFERFADEIEPIAAAAAVQPGTFWIDPQRDLPAISCSRRLAPPTVALDGLSCAHLTALLKTQIAKLDDGTPAQAIGLPDFAGTPAGLGVLRRLAGRWSDSGKRRFQRRRQNHRTILSSGIDGLWQLCQTGEATDLELSTWMITNESPDGYAVMHVSGKTGALSVGDIAAVRTGGEQNWQICLVRWAVSENPEHLELGLQILAPRAVPAILAQPSDALGTQHLRVLILPEIPLLRSSQLLVVASGALPKQRQKLILVIEKGNLVVREVKRTNIDEQTGSVDILSIEPDENPF